MPASIPPPQQGSVRHCKAVKGGWVLDRTAGYSNGHVGLQGRYRDIWMGSSFRARELWRSSSKQPCAPLPGRALCRGPPSPWLSRSLALSLTRSLALWWLSGSLALWRSALCVASRIRAVQLDGGPSRCGHQLPPYASRLGSLTLLHH